MKHDHRFTDAEFHQIEDDQPSRVLLWLAFSFLGSGFILAAVLGIYMGAK